MFLTTLVICLLVTSSCHADYVDDDTLDVAELNPLQLEQTDDDKYESYDYSITSKSSDEPLDVDDDDLGESPESAIEPKHYEPEPHYHHEHPVMLYKPRKKKVYVPVFVPEKEKKKMKIISVDKGFYIPGGTQLFGKFKSLKHCMKACAITPTCFSGDFNPWLHKCYQHTNFTACNTQGAHTQFVHFSKVPCSVVDAPAGHVTLGASMANGIEQKGIDSLQDCIKKCSQAGIGIPATATTQSSFNTQACFAIDYDFSTHRCFFFGFNVLDVSFLIHCPVGAARLPSSQGTRPNPTVIHITFCPVPTG